MKAVVLVLLTCLWYQTWSQHPAEEELDQTIKQFYTVVSFTDSATLKIDSLASLFTSDGSLIANFGKTPSTFTPSQFATNFHNNIRSGQMQSAVERELFRKTDVFGNIAHVWSSYELTITTKDGKLIRRGINSMQLLHIDGRWLISSLIWDRERDELKLPANYLPKSN